MLALVLPSLLTGVNIKRTVQLSAKKYLCGTIIKRPLSTIFLDPSAVPNFLSNSAHPVLPFVVGYPHQKRAYPQCFIYPAARVNTIIMRTELCW